MGQYRMQDNTCLFTKRGERRVILFELLRAEVIGQTGMICWFRLGSDEWQFAREFLIEES